MPDTLPTSLGADATRPHLVALAIIVPTFQERDNVAELVRRVDAALAGLDWEMIFVDDDSTDGTADAVRALAAGDRRLRCLHRIGRSGLASACIEGMLSTGAPLIAVMDADLQHDPALLPAMLTALRDPSIDIAIGSRYADGGGIGAWQGTRARASRIATRLSRVVVPENLRDPMSGFFMIRRTALMTRVRRLSGLGFKILVDLFASGPVPLRFVELPYTFGVRHGGSSKLDAGVMWEFLLLLLDKLIGRLVPVRFIAFACIGGLGVVVHFLALSAVYRSGFAGFVTGQAVASAIAMIFNFTINNRITYRDRRLSGLRWVGGLLSFMLACSVGAIANVGIARQLFERDSGWVAAALAGILVGAVWNYAATSVLTWRSPRR